MKSGVIKKNSVAVGVLKALALTGLVLVAASSPYFGLGLIKGFKKRGDRREWKKFYASLDYLNRRGYVKLLGREGEKIKVKITRSGEDVIKSFEIDKIYLKKQESWDGKWRVIIFDVPIEKNPKRRAFTDKIKELGFIMIQKSVWAYPHECYEEIMLLRKFYGIQKFVSYFEAIEIEDEREWRGRFNLANQ